MFFTVEVKVDRKAEKVFAQKVIEVYNELHSVDADDSEEFNETISADTLDALRKLQREMKDWGF